ncbi:hypothetical protein [Sulfuricurvum sp.]|uniref:hypothetical protein n=1 Tax=Sulfuricurvum sp. TaxID=2025608 RepID=UPI0035622AF1
MALINPIQPTFAGGEFSPAIFPRVDIEKYRTGLKTCRNFLIHPHGGASNRPGTKYIATAKHSDKITLVKRFVFSDTQAYILEVGDQYIRFYTDQAVIPVNVPDEWSTLNAYAIGDYATYNAVTYYAIQAGTNQQPDTETAYWTAQTIYEVPTPYLEADLRGLSFESSADVIYITHQSYQTRTLSRYGNADWRLELYSPEDGPFRAENTDGLTYIMASDTTGSVTLNANSNIFDDLHEGALWKLRHYVESNTISQAFTSDAVSASISCFTTWRLISHGTWTGKFKIEKSIDGGTTWTTLRTFSSADDYNANTSGTEDVDTNTEPFLIRISFYDYVSGTANIDLTSDAYYLEGIVRIDTFNSASEVLATVLSDLGGTTYTSSWAEGAWSDYRGYPAVARFYQDRFCLAGNTSEPMTIWMTQTGVYDSFLRHTPLLATDGITTSLPSRQLNAINGLIAMQRLIAFTSSSEWTIGANQGTGLDATSFEQTIEGYRGSNGVDPVLVGNEVIYVQAIGKVIRNLSYAFSSNSYDGVDLNILSRHLFDKWEIIDMAYQQDPDSIVWCLRDDGILLGMTYMRDQEVVAWFWIDTGTVAGNDVGQIESIATIPGDGYDELWMTVKRGAYRFIEVMSQRIVQANCVTGGKQFLLENSYFVDCGVTVGENPIYITSIDVDVYLTITAQDHGFTDGNIIRFDNIPEFSYLEGNSYPIFNATQHTFQIGAQV